jgi:hypothetical protein
VYFVQFGVWICITVTRKLSVSLLRCVRRFSGNEDDPPVSRQIPKFVQKRPCRLVFCTYIQNVCHMTLLQNDVSTAWTKAAPGTNGKACTDVQPLCVSYVVSSDVLSSLPQSRRKLMKTRPEGGSPLPSRQASLSNCSGSQVLGVWGGLGVGWREHNFT